MSQSDNWPGDDASESESCLILTSDSDESPPVTSVSKSRRRPAGKAPVPVSSTARHVDTSDEEPTIPYNVEWKLSINNWRRAGQSELGIKLAKETVKKPCQANETKFVLSTTHRNTPPITMSFEELDIDWPFVKKQLQEWNKLPNKKGRNMVTVTVTFYYTYIDTSKPTREAATAEQQGEIEARIGDGTVLSRKVCIRKAYALMRCPGLPCKHYQLHPHHPLNGHDDVPETFRRLVLDDERDREAREEKQREKQRRAKRRRRDSDGTMTVHCHSQQCSSGSRATPELIFPTTLLMVSEEQKGFYEQMQHLTLHHGYDLDMIVSNQERMLKFYMDCDIPEGFAWRYVSDIRSFHKRRQAKNV
ncbi:hypothetical protein ACQKWADRAFT_324403 [Trichoderma austrokoningii]